MTKEFEIAFKEFNISYEDYKQIYYNSVEASFADLETKERLRKLI
ncbi:hypothetical protein SDC9_206795 [bioreactor metagenome]|uniref:Uncharacterized protein n=2 Tax=root TaxID=1 RepID=A0A645J6Q7_9ZZZZ